MGWGEAIGKALSIFDRFQGNKEKRYRAEREKLVAEKEALMKNPPTKKSADRVAKIEDKIKEIDRWLKN